MTKCHVGKPWLNYTIKKKKETLHQYTIYVVEYNDKNKPFPKQQISDSSKLKECRRQL